MLINLEVTKYIEWNVSYLGYTYLEQLTVCDAIELMWVHAMFILTIVLFVAS